MKKFNEIDGFSDLKIKTDFCELRTAVYVVNGTIRKYLQAYAFIPLVEQLIKELTDSGIAIKNIKVNDKNQKQKDDILSDIRNLIRGLKAYQNEFRFDDSCRSAIKSSANYQLQRFLKAREDKSLSVEMCIELLQRNKLIYRSIKDAEQNLNTTISFPNFIKLQDDIKGELQKLIDAYDFR